MTEHTAPPDRPGSAPGRLVAGALSLVAAAMLAIVWYDDGTAARRGPAVLAPIDGLPDDVPGLGWVRIAAALTVLALLVVLAALWPAERRGTTEPARPAWWAAGMCGLAALATGLAAWRLGGHATAAVPQEALILAGAALAWAVVALGRAVRPATVAIAVVVAVAAPLGGPWWAYGRLIDRTTTDAAPPAGGAGPDRPGAVRWSHRALGSVALGRYVLLRDQIPDQHPRIVVLDAVTGAEQWSYRNTGGFVGLSGDPDSNTVVLSVNRDGAEELRAFDLPTGRPLWNRRDGGEVVGGRSNRFDSDGVVSPPSLLLLLDRRATRLRAVDPRTGARRWERAVDRDCAASAEYVRAGAVLVQTGLCYRRTVPAFRLDTGADAWTATVAPQAVHSTGPSRSAQVAGDTVALTVTDGERNTLVGLDPATGRERWRRVVRPGVLPMTVTGDRYVLAEQTASRRLVATAVDPATGRDVWSTPLTGEPRRTGDEELVAGTDGARWYLLTGVFPGGPGTTRLTVLDRDGTELGTGALDGCPKACAGGQILPADSAGIAAAGGTLVVLPSRFGIDRTVVGVAAGPAFSPAG